MISGNIYHVIYHWDYPMFPGADPEIEHPNPAGEAASPGDDVGEDEEGWGDEMEEEGCEEEDLSDNDCEIDPDPQLLN